MEKREKKRNKKKYNIKNLKPFSSEFQPTPEAKKAGWERRREAQRMMNYLKSIMDLSIADFRKLKDKINKSPQKYTLQNYILYRYALKVANSEKFLLDWMDRNVSKAPQNISGENGQPIKIEHANKLTDEQVKKLEKIIKGETSGSISS